MIRILLLCGLLLELSAQSPAPSAPAQGVPVAGEQITETPAKDLEDKADDATEINVRNADLLNLVRIFSKKTKRNYILDERVKGTVSIYLPGKISADEAINILDSVLNLKGFTTVPMSDNLWKIIPIAEAKQTTIPTLKGNEPSSNPTASIVTRFINLKYIGADEVKQLITPLISSAGLVNAYTGTNSLILIDSEENINRILELVESLDLPFTNRDMTLIPVQHAEAKVLAETIEKILLDKKSDKAVVEQDVARFRPTGMQQQAINGTSNAATPKSDGQTINPRAKEPKIIADERTNSIIVVADEDTTNRIQALVSQLDSAIDLSGNRFYVYHCQHANAEQLAEVLSNLVDGSSGSGEAKATGSEEKKNSTRERNSKQVRSSGKSRSSSSMGSDGDSESSTGSSSSTSSGSAEGSKTVKFSEDLSITSDTATNSLVIVGSKTDYEKLLLLLKELDIKRRQVLVEAVLLEVNVDAGESVNSAFLGSAGGKDGGIIAGNNAGTVSGLLSGLAGFGNSAASTGTSGIDFNKFTLAAASSGSLTLPGDVTIPSQTFVMQAIGTNNNVNILSSPTIIATDNEEAEIVVGQNVPFLASTASNSQNLNNTFNQVDRQDVGITLRLTPQISGSDFVTLKMFTEVSNVLPGTANSALGPTTTVRTSETTVTTKDNQMVVTGGLISDSTTDTTDGIPYLRNIPLLGSLFGGTTNEKLQKNLLFFITPRIIRDQFDARDLSKTKTAETDEVIADNGLEPSRDDILKSDNLDEVAEAKEFDGVKPTTITPPQVETPAENVPLKLSLEKKVDTTVKSNSKYVVFKISGAASKEFPFSVNSDGNVAIRIPNSSGDSALTFFETGKSYSYKIDKKSYNFKVQGVFVNEGEANQIFSSLNWYTLSPYEVLNLGKSPWVKN